MTRRNLFELSLGALLAFAIVVPLILWTALEPESLAVLSYEDGLIENMTAILFGGASLGFLVVLRRSNFIRERPLIISLFTVGWVLFAFLIMAEEISWGQRLFGFATPETVKNYNHQEEFNLHNLTVGGFTLNSRRIFNLLTVVIAVLFPLFLLFESGIAVLQKVGMPVLPLWCVPTCIGSFVYIKYFAFHGENFTNEVRELIFAFSIFFFAVYAAIRPDDVFRYRTRQPH